MIMTMMAFEDYNSQEYQVPRWSDLGKWLTHDIPTRALINLFHNIDFSISGPIRDIR